MNLFAKKVDPVEAEPISDEQLAIQLKESAQQTAGLAGALKRRGWQVSVTIYPDTSDKGPTASVNVYRTQTLSGE
jgi:hypothetical protein